MASDEQVLLSSQGGYRNHVRSGWKLGKLHLTNQRLLFSVQTGVVFETLLSDVHSATVEKQKYVGGRVKDVIVVISQQTASPRVSVACIIMADLETWRHKLSELTSPEIDEETLENMVGELDTRCREIVGYLWEQKHATIGELTQAIRAPSNMDVLLNIRDRINPAAQRTMGGPLLVFERAKVDEETGEPVLFSWWMTRRMSTREEAPRESFVDVFDEGDHVDILVELVGVTEEDIFLGTGRDGLVLSAEGVDRRYREEIPLPAGVSTEKISKSYANNILRISLQKREG